MARMNLPCHTVRSLWTYSLPAISLGGAVGAVLTMALLLMGESLVRSLAVAGMVVLALLPLLRNRQSDAMFALTWMVLAGMIGWLLGIRIESGPFGLVIIESWCSSTSVIGLEGALIKLQLFPLSHFSMFAGGLLGMSLAMHIRGERRMLGCCGISALLMPVAMLIADAGVLQALEYLPVRSSIQMMAAMGVAMLLAGLLTRRLAALSLAW